MASDGSESPGEPDEVLPSTRQLRPAGSLPTIFGHRGMPGRAPENTLAEVFELLGRSVVYDIEIKPYGTFWGPPKPNGPEATPMALIRSHGRPRSSANACLRQV